MPFLALCGRGRHIASPTQERKKYHLSPLWERSTRCFYAAGEGVERFLFLPLPFFVGEVAALLLRGG